MEIGYYREIAARRLFSDFKAALLEKNERINLTRIVSDEDYLHKNIEDSLKPLALSRFFNMDFFSEKKALVDIGTGGGFPLFPLALYVGMESLQASSFYGLDSVSKKMNALREIAASLCLPNVHLLSGRAEELGRAEEHRESYDAATCRAVAELPVVLEYASPFLKRDGILAVYKTSSVDTETHHIAEVAAVFSLQLLEDLEYSLSDGYGERRLLVFRKIGKIDRRFPRGNGIPRKNPIRSF